MSRWIKKSSGSLTGSGILTRKHSHYFGFTMVIDSVYEVVKNFKAYNALSAIDGREVEEWPIKPGDYQAGHSHADPVLCVDGIYYSVPSGARAIIYYWDEIS